MDVRVYTQVRVHGVQCTRRGIVYRVSFECDRPVQWDKTKRLLYGYTLHARSGNRTGVLCVCVYVW